MIKIDFFESEGIAQSAMATGMIIIQTVPMVIALCVMAWLLRSLYGDLVDEKAEAILERSKSLRRKMSRSVKGAAKTVARSGSRTTESKVA